MKFKKVVLDTTALVFLDDFSGFEEAYTVQEVVEEVKDRMTSFKLSTMSKDLKIMEPGKKSVEEINSIAKETGDLKKLSETDIKVLALAKKLNCVIISDDYNIQNVAGHMGVEFVSLFNPAIKRLIKWKKRKL